MCSLQEESDCKDLNQFEDLLGRMYGARGKLSISRTSLGQNSKETAKKNRSASIFSIKVS